MEMLVGEIESQKSKITALEGKVEKLKNDLEMAKQLHEEEKQELESRFNSISQYRSNERDFINAAESSNRNNAQLIENIKVSQIAFAFEILMIAKLNVPKNLPIFRPKTFQQLQDLLNQDWTEFEENLIHHSLQAEKQRIIEEFNAIQLTYSQKTALRHLKDLRKYPNHPFLNLKDNEEVKTLKDIINKKFEGFQLDCCIDFLDRATLQASIYSESQLEDIFK